MTSASGYNINNEWYTPSIWLDMSREVFGGPISLDPASNAIANDRVKALKYHDVKDSGLKAFWYGNVFVNPPYSHPELSLFLRKAVKEYKNGKIDNMIVLTNSGTDTKWSRIITREADCIAFTIGRISFIRPNGDGYGSTSRGQMFCYFGKDVDKFMEVFTRDDKCWIPNLKIYEV